MLAMRNAKISFVKDEVLISKPAEVKLTWLTANLWNPWNHEFTDAKDIYEKVMARLGNGINKNKSASDNKPLAALQNISIEDVTDREFIPPSAFKTVRIV